MVAIRIEEREQNAFNAVASFDGSSEYPVKIADPFLPEEEARLEWYFEWALQALPSVHYLLEQT
jgi:hypothetical protein